MFWRKQRPPKPEATEAAQGRKLLEKGFAAKAEPLLRQAVEQAPTSLEAWVDLGAACFYQRKLDEALAAWRRALQLAPGQPSIRLNLAVALHQAGRTDEALSELRSLSQSHPRLADVHYNLALALASRGEVDEAADEARAELTLDRRHRGAATLLANLVQVQLDREGQVKSDDL